MNPQLIAIGVGVCERVDRSGRLASTQTAVDAPGRFPSSAPLLYADQPRREATRARP